MRLMVGCPVRDRSWIIDRYFQHITDAALHAGIYPDEITFVFVGDDASDETFRRIEECAESLKAPLQIVHHPGSDEPYRRTWGWERFLEMAVLRNILLHQARETQPELFWSLDSDILVARNTLQSAIEATSTFDAVGSKCYMTPLGKSCPSYAMLTPSGNLHRPDAEGLHKVDVIMAAKLMTPKAYNVDYAAHRQGEDIAWSIAARKAGCTLGWDGRTVSRHVMGPEDLDKHDSRCGF